MRCYLDIVCLGVHGTPALTYHSQEELLPGQIVKVPVGSKQTFGMVTRKAAKQPFKTKPVTQVLDLPPLPAYVIETIEWMHKYYATDAANALRLFMPARPDIKGDYQLKNINTSADSHDLTQAQKQVLKEIINSRSNQWLLHGVTGSGKTAIYIEICKKMLSKNKSSIVLVPEITLTTQVVAEFQKTLGNQVIVTHSALSNMQRRKLWLYARQATHPLVIIGPRSALFTPQNDLGAIIIDECHEPSYKQEKAPYYHARDVAAFISNKTNAKLILGSATPSSQDIYLHRQKKLKLTALPSPIHHATRSVSIVDMRKQPGIFSPELVTELNYTLNQNQQSLLFINRRGSASQVVCADCGWLANCKNCEVPQTWHADSGRLRCHWCGKTDSLPGKCPDCDSLNWRFLGFGTKRIESEVRKLFPDAKVLRLDKDSFSADTITDIMQRLRQGKIDILIGTQMIAKGLDLPQLTLVGVVLADTMLHIPDLGSNERTYQLIHQIIGRAGRSHGAKSQVIIQTYNPKHQAIQAASKHDFETFIGSELEDRHHLNYPPYRYLLKLTCKRKTAHGAKNAASTLASKLRRSSDITVRGPAPAWRERVNNNYYWHIIVTSKDRDKLLNIMQKLPTNWKADIDPVDLL